MRKKGEILLKTFFMENTIYVWKYFILNIQANSFCPQPVLFSYGYRLCLTKAVERTTTLVTTVPSKLCGQKQR